MLIRLCSLAVIGLISLSPAALRAGTVRVVDFEDITLGSSGFDNGSGGAGGFTSRGATFNNSFTDFGGGFVSWSGWSISNRGDNTTAGFTNQYSSYAGGGFGGSGNFGVAFVSGPNESYIDLPSIGGPVAELSARITNTTYAALSMKNGDQFAKKFGGTSGNDADYLLLTITGFDGLGATGNAIGSFNFYLADYRFADNSLDYIVDAWELIDLSSLVTPNLRSLGFSLTSSDVGQFGMNTPAYFALDNLTLRPVPEPSAWLLMALGGLGLAAVGRRSSRPRA